MAITTDDDVIETIGLDIDAELRLRGVAKEEAKVIAVDVTQKLRLLYGGANIYFPKSHLRKLSQRDAEILDAFDGKNYAELAFKHGLSEMRIRQIVEKIRSANRGEHRMNPHRSVG